MLSLASGTLDAFQFPLFIILSSNLSPKTGTTLVLTKTRKRRQLGRKGHRKKKEEERRKDRKTDIKTEKREGRRKKGREGMKKKDENNPSFKCFLMDFLVMQAHFPWPSLNPAENGYYGG